MISTPQLCMCSRRSQSERRRLVVTIIVTYCIISSVVNGFSTQQCLVGGPAVRHNNKVKIRAQSNDNNNRRKRIITGIISSQDISATSEGTTSATLNPIEYWCTTHINVLYDKSLSMKCPFFRRRSTDILDSLYMIMRFVIIRHKSLPLIERHPPGCRAISTYAAASTNNMNMKHKNLNIHDLVETIRMDWKSESTTTSESTKQLNKGYYITGRLNATIYRDDCWFDGPDPDMPVRGVRKYLNAASQLFDTKTSTAELLALEIGNDIDRDNDNDSGDKYQIQNKNEDTIATSTTTTTKTILTAIKKKIITTKTENTKATIIAKWRLQGVLHLPWHPSLPIWTGKTIYHLDDEHMIYRHEEYWDISVMQAFTQTLMPEVGNLIWKQEEESVGSGASPAVAATAVE
jgi:hypothetical protein